MGHHGCPGPEGMPGSVFIGSAYGPINTNEAVQIIAQQFGATAHTVTAPLFHGKVSCEAPFSFNPYIASTGGYFTVKTDGEYLLQYGLVGVPSTALVSDFVNPGTIAVTELQTSVIQSFNGPQATLWIAIQVTHCDTTRLVGAVPLSLTWTRNADPAGTNFRLGLDVSSEARSEWICSGFGQIPVCLECGDQVSLQIFLASTASSQDIVKRILYIDSNNITHPFIPGSQPPVIGDGIARGPTLTIQKIGCTNLCHPCCH